ncbi:MAG TPA: circadian clock protein KaiC [Polyangiales bacterium]
MVKQNKGCIRYVPTGIVGFDEVIGGGLPAERITVVLGGAGSGKTIFGAQLLAAGARDHAEAGLFVAFEESAKAIFENAATFTWNIDSLRSKIEVLDARLSESVVHGGDFDLLGLLAVIGAKAKATGAKRIVLDGLDVLLGHLGDSALARREVFRLRDWLHVSGMTAVITAKAGADEAQAASDYDFLQFMADCVVTMQHRVVAGTALRLIRVAKCRGGAHSANEFPFSITDAGIEVGAGSNTELRHVVSARRVSSGMERLDGMLSGGYYRGSSTLITGAPGTAKTTLAAAFADAASRRKERTLFVSFDEAPEQIVRNVESIGIHLAPHIRAGTLKIYSLRSRVASPEAHVASIRALLREHRADNLIVDPISALAPRSGNADAEGAAVHIVDLAKTQGITSVITSLLGNAAPLTKETPIGISTIADTWMHLAYVVNGGERNRALTIVKSRGTGHSNQVRELVLTSAGITFADVYSVDGEVLMGTLRWQTENEQGRLRKSAKRDAEFRQREAELAVAETKVRAQAVVVEQAVREATLERLKLDRESDVSQTATQNLELLHRRGDDDLRVAPLQKAKRSRR